MASSNLKNVQLNWENCPSELLRLIYIYLAVDFKSLIICKNVCRRWKDVAEDFIMCFELWPNIVEEEMENMGVTFLRKSIKLDWDDLLLNSVLWSYVSRAPIQHYQTYKMENIICMNMNRDKLVVKTRGNVKYFDITNSKLSGCYQNSPSDEIDFTENDYMIATVQQCVFSVLHLFAKVTPNDRSCSKDRWNCIEHVKYYRLEDEVCYVIYSESFICCALRWNEFEKRWGSKLVARYYGGHYDGICGMHVFDDRVSIITRHGLVFCEDRESKKFDKLVFHNISQPRPGFPCRPGYRCAQPDYNFLSPESEAILILFNKANVAVSEKTGNRRISVSRVIDFEGQVRIKLECVGMTCATEHGNILFVGFNDGTVAICKPKDMLKNDCKPELWLNVIDFDQSIEHPSVLGIEVHEAKETHHLFIATNNKIIHLILTHPG